VADFDIINIHERALTSISLGESHFREYKSALHGTPNGKTPRDTRQICRDIAEALVAFANADGGELLVGVEDNGSVTGIESLRPDAIAQLEEAPRTHVHRDTPLPPIKYSLVNQNEHSILYFSVHKSTTHVHLTSDGRCLQRRDLETVPIPPEQILLDRKEKLSREYDRTYVDGATIADLNQDLLGIVADRLSSGMSHEKCLQYLDLAEFVSPGLRLRKAAVILFAKDPNRWHPRLQVRIIKVNGLELRSGAQYNVKSDQTVTGNLLELIERGWDSLRPQLVQTRLGMDARFGPIVMYPELACREALVNAIAHRDYSEEGRAIEIYVFDDRMEVRNPGSLLSSISIADLMRFEGVHQSRNSMSARVLREMGYMRELGEGMRRIFDLMRTNELVAPVIKSDANSFCITLRHTTIYNDQQKLWIEQFEKFGLDREQKAIVVLGMGGKLIAPQDVWDSLGLVDTERYRQLIRSLQDIGILTSDVSKTAAQRQARQRRMSVRKIPRFKISVPRVEPIGNSDQCSAHHSSAAEDSAPVENASIYIANIPYSANEKSLTDFLLDYADVESVYIPTDRYTGRSKGYAFAAFANQEIASDVLSKLSESEFEGRKLIARTALGNAMVKGTRNQPVQLSARKTVSRTTKPNPRTG